MTLQRILKITGLAFASFVGFILLYLLASYGLSRIAVGGEEITGDEVTIYLLSNGVHTDIVVPVKSEVIDWSQIIKYNNTIANDTTAQWIAFGWGDKGFYLETPTWADLRFSVAFKAAFSLSTSAVHTTFYNELRESETCKSLKISKSQYQHLVDFIQNSLSVDEQGEAINITTDAIYGNNDAFYEAVGKYSLFHTCNTWANNALKAAGQKASLWTPFATGIFYHYKNF